MEEKISKLNSIKKICRTCLTENGDLRNIFDSIDPNLKTQTSNMLTACTSLQTDNNDGLPPTICTDCEIRLHNAFDFRELALKSYDTLKNYLSLDQVPPSQVSNADEFLIVEEKEILIEMKDETLETNSNYERSEEDERSEPENKKNKPKPKTKTRKNERGGSRIRTAAVDPVEVNQVLAESKKRCQEKRECRLCGFICLNARGLSLHISHIHKEMKNRWCPLCYMEVDDLLEHKKKHSQEKLYKCPFCDKDFRAQGHLTEHIRGHSGERPHKCSVCKKGFLSGRHLRVHFRIHTGEKPFECDICNKRFTQKSGLQSHMAIHNIKQTYKCAVCHEEWAKLKWLCQHIMQAGHEQPLPDDVKAQLNKEESTLEMTRSVVECSIDDSEKTEDPTKKLRDIQKKDAPKYVAKVVKDVKADNKLCNVCGRSFRLATKLRLHMRIHTGDTPYSCQFCNKHVSTRSQLVVHERTHTGEKPHICHICGRGFAQSSVLNTHMRLHTGRPEECMVCGQRFCRPTELRLHMRKHTGEKPYLCPECGQAFIQMSHLKEHIKTHSDERPHPCPHCSRAFKQKTTLRSHIRIHTGEKPYRCSECPYRCRQSYSLTQHMRTHSKPNAEPSAEPNTRTLVCLICMAQFPTVALLNQHTKTECALVL